MKSYASFYLDSFGMKHTVFTNSGQKSELQSK